MSRRRSDTHLKRMSFAEEKTSSPEESIDKARRSTKSFKFFEAAAALVGLAGVVAGWGFNLRIVLPIAALLLIGGILLLILDWAGLISRGIKAGLVTTVICCYVTYVVVLGGCVLISAIW